MHTWMAKVRWGLALLVGLCAAGLAPEAGGAQIVFSAYGGDYGEVMRKHVLIPFEKRFGAKVIYDETGNSAEKLAKLRATKGTYTHDVVLMVEYDAAAAGREGLLDPIGPVQVPNFTKLYPFAQTLSGGFGPVVAMDVLTLVYNKNQVKPPPTSWEALWDPKYKGRVAISHVSEGKGLYLLLLASFMTGGSEKDVDRAFTKIGQVVPNVGAWLTASPQYVPYLQREEVWITPYWNGRTQLLKDQGLPIDSVIPKEGTIPITNVFTVPKTAKDKDLAHKFINFFLEEVQQRAWAEAIYYGPTNKEVKVSPEVARRIPYGPEQIDALKFPDQEVLVKSRRVWVERWNKEIQNALRYAK